MRGQADPIVTKYLGVNDAGVKVGFYTDRRGVNVGFEVGAKGAAPLRIRPPGSVSVIPSGVNDQGEVVGYMTTSRGSVEAFLWHGGSFIEFPILARSKPGRLAPTSTARSSALTSTLREERAAFCCAMRRPTLVGKPLTQRNPIVSRF